MADDDAARPRIKRRLTSFEQDLEGPYLEIAQLKAYLALKEGELNDTLNMLHAEREEVKRLEGAADMVALLDSTLLARRRRRMARQAAADKNAIVAAVMASGATTEERNRQIATIMGLPAGAAPAPAPMTYKKEFEGAERELRAQFSAVGRCMILKHITHGSLD